MKIHDFGGLSDERSDSEKEEPEEDGSPSSGERSDDGPGDGSDGDQSDNSTIVQAKPGSFIGERLTETKLARRLKSKLRRLLDATETSGDFISSFITENPVNPGLEIDDYGSVGLPISQQCVESLLERLQAAESPQSPPTDTSFFRDAIKFSNPAWNSTLAHVHTKLSEALFVNTETVLGPSRLILCGASDVPRQELQNFLDENALGRLMITLPCHHSGVEVHVTNAERRENISLSAQQCFASLAAMWLRDSVVDTVSAPNQGYFAAIIYDVIDSRANRGLVSVPLSLGAQVATYVSDIRGLLTTWVESMPSQNYREKTLAYQLTQFHPDDILQISALDAQDRATLRCLERACEGTPYTLYLANVSRQIEGSRDDDNDPERISAPSSGNASIGEFSSDDVTFSRVISLGASNVNGSPQFDKTWFIQNDVYNQARVPDEEEEDDAPESDDYYGRGYSGRGYYGRGYDDDEDEDVVVRHTYNDTVCSIECIIAVELTSSDSAAG